MTNEERLAKARAVLQAKKEAGESLIPLTPIEASNADPASRSKAIKAKCYECMGGDCETNWRKAIKLCSSYECPLHKLRPYK